jgi:PAS domain S-box-containing protein
VPQMLVQCRPSPGLGNGGGASVSRSRLTASLVTLTAFMHFRTGGETVLKRKVQLAFGSAIVILLVVGAVSYRGIFLSSESDRWVRHTHEVLENLQNLVVDMERIESSDRGFALTGEVGYLESYRTSVLSAGQDAAAVRTLTVDNPKQLLQISALEALMAQKIRLGDLAILLRRTEGIEAAADAIGNGQGQRIMTECLGNVSKMQDEELRLLLLRNVESNRRRAQTKTILLFGTILGVLIAVGAGWMVSRDIAARGLAEDALREGEERFRNLANNISQLAWMADAKGSIFWYNQRWFDYSGTAFEEMAGWGWQKVHHPDHVERVVEKISRCFQNGEVWEDTFPLRGRDGKYRWFLSRAVPIRDSEGEVFRWFGTNTDISESKEAERHLAQMESRYRGLLEAAPDAIVVVNPAGKIVLLNVQAEKQFGYSRDELVGQEVTNIIPEGFAERLIADGTRSAAEALAQQIGTGIELSGRRKDGTEFSIEIMLSPLDSAEGILVTAAIRDITARKVAEEALKESLTTSKAALKDLADQKFALDQHARVSITDVYGTITYVNEKFCDISKFSRQELIGQNHRILNSGRHSRGFFQQMYQTIGSGKVWRGEIENRAKDCSTYWIDAAIVPFVGEDGKPHQYVGIGTDITQRKKADEDLLKTVGELKRSNDDLQQFAYVSSHDLQEPLRMVSSYTQLLAKRYQGRLDSDADEFVAFAVDGCNRMQTLIQDLLAYSRAGTDGNELHEVSSDNALQKALSNLRIAIEQSAADVTHGALPVVTTDAAQLTQVFQNLVGNAIKYRGAEAPRVHVSATRNGGNEWTFSVRDNGLGIDPQYFERIFILFQRLHGRDEFEGTGIGLAICKKLLERLGGRIWVESQPEKGSTFYFALPDTEEK